MGSDPTGGPTGVTGRGILSTIAVTDSAQPSVEVAAAQDRAVRAILDDAYARARSLLLGRMDLLDAVAGYLYEHERMTGDEFEAIVAGTLRPTSTSDWRSPAASPRPWDEIPGVFANLSIGDRRSGASPGAADARRAPVSARATTGARPRRRGLTDRVLRRPFAGAIARLGRLAARRRGRPGAPT